jgi:hypothetical protein
MTIRLLRLLTVAAALLALALPAAGVAASGDKPVDRGVVQSVSQTQIVLTALDGSVLAFSVSPDTRVRLNGSRATLGDIRPGFVANVTHNRRARAIAIMAFGTPATVTDRGTVTTLTPSAITLRTPGGDSLSFAIDRNTRFRFQGLPARRFAARPGALVTVTHATDAPALVVNVLKRAGA